mgnify:FL=1
MKPGGKIVIAEENTPWNPKYVERYLKHAGFSVVEFQDARIGSSKIKNPKWTKLRREFYQDKPMGLDRPWGTPYIMVGQKPESLEHEEKKVGRFVYKKGKENTEPSLFQTR